MMVWHEMQRRIGEDEVNLIVWLPCFDVLLYESGGDDAGTRDSEHIVGQIKADDRRARKGRGPEIALEQVKAALKARLSQAGGPH
jgi:hypothetical protein